MGESSVSCALSGLTLYDDPVVFLPLSDSCYPEKLKGSRLIGYREQPCVLFSPMTLPYKGILDGYGRLREIEHDENTALIEECFSISIEDFTEACIIGDPIIKNGESVPGTGCYIHREIYDRFSQSVSGGKYAGSLWLGQFAGKPHLEAIGCVFACDLGEKERYRYVYRHPAITGINFCTDGRFTHLVNTETGETLYGFSLNKIQATLRKTGFPIFPREDVAKVRTIQELPKIFELELIKSIEQKKQALREFMLCHRVKEPLLDISDKELIESEDLFCQSLCFLSDGADKRLTRKYFKVLFQGRMLDEVAKLACLISAFAIANRTLMPTITGSQYPENGLTSVITGYVDRLAKKRIRDHQQP